MLLARIFNIQDHALKKNLQGRGLIEKLFFISECLDLVNSISFKDKDEHKGINFLLNDINTGIICSTRLGLYGCSTDAALITRVALENMAILDYVIDKSKYNTLIEGLRRGFQKVRINFESISQSVDPKVKKLHIKLSNLFSHSTKYRILYSGVHEIGRECIGVSLNRARIEELLAHLCSLVLFLTRIMADYLKKNNLEKKNYFEKQDELERIYSSFV